MTPEQIDYIATIATSGDHDERLQARAVLEAARAETSPLHGLFEWDDSIAGERYRLDQARGLIRRVRVEYRIEEHRYNGVRYIKDPEAAGRTPGYVTIARVAEDERASRAALLAEFKRVESAVRRGREIAYQTGQPQEFEAMLRGLLTPSVGARHAVNA